MLWALVAAGALAGFGVALAWRTRRRIELRAELLDRLATGCRRALALPPWLEAAAEGRAPRERQIYQDTARRLREGMNLGDALESLPRGLLTAPVVGAVRAAEGTARLPRVLEATAAHSGEVLAVRHRAYLASLYPLLLGILVLGLHVTCVGLLDGRLSRLYSFWRRPSPETAGLALLLVGCVVAVVLAAFLLRRFGFFPGAWRLAAARVLSTGAGLVSAGVPLAAALRRAAPAAGHHRLARHVRRAADAVYGGEDPGRLWDAMHLPVVDRLRLNAAGHRLATVLGDVAATSLARWREANDAWLRWLGPVAVVGVGILVLVDFRIIMGLLESARSEAQLRPW